MFDPYDKMDGVQFSTYRQPGFVTDVRMAQHRNEWDTNYPEGPQRFQAVYDRLKEHALIELMSDIPSRRATEEELLSLHSQESIDLLKRTSGSTDNSRLEEISSKFDAIFVNSATYDAALIAVGCTVELVDLICKGDIPSGFALVRPPGHHAMKSEFNGYCFFNNVALATQHALTNHGVQRVMILDWDVHHGQGTQQMFQDDPRVLYISVHRYEHGLFWPNLREGDVDFVGTGNGAGRSVNIPLNATGMGNAEYSAILQRVVLPMATEFDPELVIVSAGYDSALGDEKGEMEVTPAFYAHMLWSLKTLARGKVAVVLEGGYCLESLAESAALTARALIGHPCPNIDSLGAPHPELVKTIMNVICAHQKYWNCFVHPHFEGLDGHYVSEVQVFHEPAPRPDRFETRDCYPIQDDAKREMLLHQLQVLRENTRLTFPANRVCFAYDATMAITMPRKGSITEEPKRIEHIYNKLAEFNLVDKCRKVPSRMATTEELVRVHTLAHVQEMQRVSDATLDDQATAEKTYNSVQIDKNSYTAASLACGNLMEVLSEVCSGNSQSGFALIRPPGHHACQNTAMGFCFFNNVAVGAHYVLETFPAFKKILIVDWDAHHGNGTQNAFYKDDRVLYMSMHLYMHQTFFPQSPEGGADQVGEGAGKGFNVNIPWDDYWLQDADYLSAFHNVIMPIAYEFNPDLVIVSCGLDAVVNDPVGKCSVTPQAFGHFTNYLLGLANGKVVLALEGGYLKASTSTAMTACVKALLGHPIPSLTPGKKRASHTIEAVMKIQSAYWKSLAFNQAVKSSETVQVKTVPFGGDEPKSTEDGAGTSGPPDLEGSKDGADARAAPDVMGSEGGAGTSSCQCSPPDLVGSQDGAGDCAPTDVVGFVDGTGISGPPDLLDSEDGAGVRAAPDVIGSEDGADVGTAPDVIGSEDGAGVGTAPDVIGSEDGAGVGTAPDVHGSEDCTGVSYAPDIICSEDDACVSAAPDVIGSKDDAGVSAAPDVHGSEDGAGVSAAPDVIGSKDGAGVSAAPDVHGSEDGAGVPDMIGSKDGANVSSAPDAIGFEDGAGVGAAPVVIGFEGDMGISSPQDLVCSQDGAGVGAPPDVMESDDGMGVNDCPNMETFEDSTRNSGSPAATLEDGTGVIAHLNVTTLEDSMGVGAPPDVMECDDGMGVGAPPDVLESDDGMFVSTPPDVIESDDGMGVSAPPDVIESDDGMGVSAPPDVLESDDGMGVSTPPDVLESDDGMGISAPPDVLESDDGMGVSAHRNEVTLEDGTGVRATPDVMDIEDGAGGNACPNVATMEDGARVGASPDIMDFEDGAGVSSPSDLTLEDSASISDPLGCVVAGVTSDVESAAVVPGSLEHLEMVHRLLARDLDNLYIKERNNSVRVRTSVVHRKTVPVVRTAVPALNNSGSVEHLDSVHRLISAGLNNVSIKNKFKGSIDHLEAIHRLQNAEQDNISIRNNSVASEYRKNRNNRNQEFVKSTEYLDMVDCLMNTILDDGPL